MHPIGEPGAGEVDITGEAVHLAFAAVLGDGSVDTNDREVGGGLLQLLEVVRDRLDEYGG